MKRFQGLITIFFLTAMLSACASSPGSKSVVIRGENQIVELDGGNSCRVVKSGVRNFRCVPMGEVASRAKRK